jgi:hypothetical protein
MRRSPLVRGCRLVSDISIELGDDIVDPGKRAVPLKANQDRRRHIPRQRYQVTNWPGYDAALRQHGSLTMWLSKAAIAVGGAGAGWSGVNTRGTSCGPAIAFVSSANLLRHVNTRWR